MNPANLPIATPTIHPNGDVFLELTHQGQAIGGVNMTKLASGLFARLGWFQPDPGPSQLAVQAPQEGAGR